MTLRMYAVLALVLVVLAGCDSQPQQYIRDEQGRALVLHGLNVTGSAKDDPRRLPWIEQPDAERLSRDWGFNLARFLIFWDAVEPEPGVYDDTYLDAVAERIRWLRDAGVYVVLDMHQDVWGKRDQTGQAIGFDGAPDWAGRNDGLIHTPVDPWALNYFQPTVVRLFDNFWNDQGPHADLQQHYAAMWKHIAERFRDEPAVLGYNLMNEPSAGRAVYGDLNGVVVGNYQRAYDFAVGRYFRFHQRMISAIREVDPDGWIFFEPLAFPANNGGPSYLPPISDVRSGSSHIAYFPHIYPLEAEARGAYLPSDRKVIRDWARERDREARAQGSPMLIGELGIVNHAGGDPLGFLQDMLDMADRHTSGWACWAYDRGGGFSVLDADGNENSQFEVMVRPYARRISGAPRRAEYDVVRRVLYVEFSDDGLASGPTEIYLPARRLFADGWRLHVSDAAGSWSSTWDEESETLLVTTPKTGRKRHILIVTPPMDCDLFSDDCGTTALAAPTAG